MFVTGCGQRELGGIVRHLGLDKQSQMLGDAQLQPGHSMHGPLAALRDIDPLIAAVDGDASLGHRLGPDVGRQPSIVPEPPLQCHRYADELHCLVESLEVGTDLAAISGIVHADACSEVVRRRLADHDAHIERYVMVVVIVRHSLSLDKSSVAHGHENGALHGLCAVLRQQVATAIEAYIEMRIIFLELSTMN